MDYPNDSDGDALRGVASEGADMDRPMEIDFFVAVPDQRSGESIAAKVAQAGYKIELSFDSESGEWTCYCSKTMLASYKGVVAAQAELDRLSEEFQGFTDGWGTFGNAQSG